MTKTSEVETFEVEMFEDQGRVREPTKVSCVAEGDSLWTGLSLDDHLLKLSQVLEGSKSEEILGKAEKAEAVDTETDEIVVVFPGCKPGTVNGDTILLAEESPTDQAL